MSQLIGAALIGSIVGLAVAYLIIMLITVTPKGPPKRAARQKEQAPSDCEIRRVRLTFPNLEIGADETTELVAALTWEADAIVVNGKADGYLTITLTTRLDRATIAETLGRDDFDFEEVADDGTT